ncbi:alkylation response protein AidB-like acyl-CoA dehydrogenase [Actinoplanes octamycinicus]|uniref:Alkylation response protein AidB-like acyl-CoA dehydrogenase n=1 Tax=Actinoplanes octamycinicus TaxID=135948 RepID=A0A7W7M6X6_9ACTN|nr:acyl-CoA dehydrogenase [Actinoplanes octamycinicus]MBB4739141.1 alkylation response protein AidB-like acyl-CoA dehydrogenase [Actinoplanes octamycinicus]GIE58884.1 acyl-CoA dehydrogenase [Actinoplanes octamycinicus]
MTTLADAMRSLEEYLGDPADPGSRMPAVRALQLDEREEYPHEFLAALRTWGLQDWIIPVAHGGKAVHVEDGLHLIRAVARRDATAATAMSIACLSFMPIWIAGTHQQGQYHSDLLRAGGKIAWGLSERGHGSDVLANETRARKVDGGWVLDGEKWLIGNCSLADVVCVQARTDDRPGPGAYSIFAVEKRRITGGSWTDLPNEPLHGLRGLDMSGIRMDGCRVGDDALIGRVGQGLEITLKASQLVRININGLAMGCADTALRTTLDFAVEREIFGERVADIPYSRGQLVECFAELLIADAMAAGAVRALQVAPKQVSVWSSAAKYLLPTMLDRAVGQLAVVLGARHYLRTGPHALFQKMARDLPVANFADGNTVVNLKNIVAQLGQLLDTAATAGDERRAAAAVTARELFDLRPPAAAYEPWTQELNNRGIDDAVLALPESVAGLRDRGWTGPAKLGEQFLGELDRMRAELTALRAAWGRAAPRRPEAYELAKRYCVVLAAASCVHLFRFGREVIDPRLADPAVLHVCLARLWQVLHPTAPLAEPEAVEHTARALLTLHQEGRSFGFRAWPSRFWLSEGGRTS